MSGLALWNNNGHLIFLTMPGPGLGTWSHFSESAAKSCKGIETQRSSDIAEATSVVSGGTRIATGVNLILRPWPVAEGGFLRISGGPFVSPASSHYSYLLLLILPSPAPRRQIQA